MDSLAGSFLVASPRLKSPHFTQSVVLLLRHNADGAFGLVVNRPSPQQESFPVFCGGPCEAEGLLMLHGHAEWVEPDVPGAPPREVASGVYLGDAQCLTHVTESKPGSKFRYRLFTGFSGWGPGQLEGELAAGVWSIHPASGHLLFDIPVDDLWELLALPKIPQPSLN